MNTRPWLQGAGLAMLYLLPPLGQFLSPARRNLYHQLLPATTLTRGLLIDVLALAILCGIGFVLVERAAPRLKQFLWLVVFFVAAWIVTRDIASTISDNMLHGRVLRMTPYIPWIVLAVAFMLLLLTPRIYGYLLRGAAVILAAGGIAALLVIIPRLVISSFSRMPQEQAGFTHPVTQNWQPGETRVVWILFDELSYRQVFEHPQPKIVLPAFSRFAAESISFSQLSPVGYETEQVIPSLLVGKPIVETKADAQGNLILRHTEGSPWQHFNQNATLFADAKNHGWATGVAGWYNPYCRILRNVLDRCYWTFGQSVAGVLFSRLSSRQSSWQNALAGLPLAARFEERWNKTPPNQALVDDYRNILSAGEALIRDPRIRFAFIHMPVPHPPGLFPDPETGAPDYLGNLLLADRAMAEFLKTFAGSTAAADTVMIVSSDHSWRVPLWRGTPQWTPAEERATDGGVFDQRPVLMVRFPNQTRPQRIDRPESAMIVHSLVQDLISGKVRTPEEWLATLLPAPAAQH